MIEYKLIDNDIWHTKLPKEIIKELNNWIKECDKICKETDTKVLHLFSFSTKELNFRDYNWDVDLPNAYREKSLAKISYDYQTPDNDEQEFIEPGWKTLPNHMNYAGNKVVSEIVLGMLQ